VVDWGNGNIDHTGCGSCRLENIYKKEGRYTLTVKVIDLNATSGSDVVTQATVTVNVIPPSIACAAAGTDFESVAGAPGPVSVGGATYSDAGVAAVINVGTAFGPYILNQAFEGSTTTLTVALDSDKTSFKAGLVVGLGGTGSYQAFSSTGALVASGPLSFAPIPVTITSGAFAEVASSAPFRTVVFNFGFPGYFIDNVSAGCK
jgi:hypothetical protein